MRVVVGSSMPSSWVSRGEQLDQGGEHLVGEGGIQAERDATGGWRLSDQRKPRRDRARGRGADLFRRFVGGGLFRAEQPHQVVQPIPDRPNWSTPDTSTSRNSTSRSTMPSATSGTEHKAVVLPTAFTGMPEPFVVEPGLPTTAVSDFSGAAGTPHHTVAQGLGPPSVPGRVRMPRSRIRSPW